ncbi:MAG: hypothetical protein LUD68_08720 [Rikenellaceae bacterium]|nr:hypothetical protein [Rikenellaceae bacterium]
MKSLFILSLLMLSFVSCTNSLSERAKFESGLEQMIEDCTRPLLEISARSSTPLDSITARNICRCCFEKMYRTDSTYFRKSFTSFQSFVEDLPADFFEECRERWIGSGKN